MTANILAWVRTSIAVTAFGFLIERFDLFLEFVFGSAWIMFHLNHNLMPMNRLLEMQR
ncbi:MAG: DUF202 domain-containing protein [Alphaproteobacteria bacterium]|nr:DUF202 domain-containing protein [Alphaproteobacteria bacterium]